MIAYTQFCKWTKAIDRGGLIHVDDTVYMVFAEIELVVRRHLKTKKAHNHRYITP